MQKKQVLQIGLFGYGCVGQGFYQILKQCEDIGANIKRIAIKNLEKSRNIPAQFFTNQEEDILEDHQIDLIVEAIDDADAAFDIVKKGLEKGIPVVSANKRMIANRLSELLFLQEKHQTPFLYDAAVCGSIPIIRNIEEYYQNDRITSVETICNGTTNYILTQTARNQGCYDTILKKAQALGFAESDPTLDVQGYDPKFKLIILTAHAFGLVLQPEEVWNYGIQHISSEDITFAQARKYTIKLVAKAQKTPEGLRAYVAPHFIEASHPFYHVHDENNAVAVHSEYANQQVLYGKGAGSLPTGASVFSDVYGVKKAYKYGYKGIKRKNGLQYRTEELLRVYVRFQTKAQVEDIGFSAIEEEKDSYIIGHIPLKKLLNAELNDRRGIFVCVF